MHPRGGPGVAAGLAGLLLALVAGAAPGAAQEAGPSVRETASAAVSARLAGRVVDAGTGKPLAGAEVMVEGPVRRSVVTRDDGRWSLASLEPGAYAIRVRHLAYAPLERRVEVPTGAGPLALRLTPKPVDLEALVVTAGRRLQRLADAPVAIELVGRREIEETGAADLAAVLTERAGIELDGGHPAGAGVMIQGLGSERVMILVDGQPFVGRISGEIDVSRIPTSMIERVEVVKGPQSTLYGSEAMGGVVNIITRQLDETAWTGSSTLLAGSQGRMDLSASMMGGRGAVTGLVDVGRRAMDVAPGRPGGDPGAGVTRWDGMAKVGWAAPVDGLRLEASGTLLDERQRWSSGQLNHFADNLQWSGRVGGQLQRGRHNVSSNVYLTAFNHLSRRATSGEPVPGTGDEETQRLAELEVLYNVALGEHAIDAGLEARTEGISSDRVIGADRTFRMLDLFAQGTVQLGELSLVPGVRGTWSDPWGNQFTPRVAAMYRPTESLALRVAAGQGFRAPAFKELFLQFLNTGPGFGYTVRGNPDLRPETSNNLTASLEWTGTTTYLRAQLFNNDFDDFIETRAVTDSANVSIFTYGNVDSGFTRGVEVEAGAAFGGWRIESGLALLEAENGQTGEILLGRPELSARGTLSHARPGGLRVALTGVHTGSTPMRRTEDGVVDWREPFTRFDLRVAQDLPGGLRFVAGVDNVLDQIVAEWPGFVGRQFYTSLSWQTGGARAGGMR